MRQLVDPTQALIKSRRHDLDALRAVAMLLGIVLHALMSFFPVGWIVRDSQAGPWATTVVAAIHGFRMPLFFLVSGFFTAMLWRSRGMKALLQQRYKRIFLPLAIGMVTIVPAVWAVGSIVSSPTTPLGAQVDNSIEESKKAFDQTLDIPLLTAAMLGDSQQLSQLLQRGANVNAHDERGSTSLHVACLFGHAEVARRLVDAGIDVTVVNADGSRAADTLQAPWGLTKFYADLLQVKLSRNVVAQGRQEIATLLGETIAPQNSVATNAGNADAGEGADWSGVMWLLLYFPVFHHLWFLWFLCWLVVGFAVCVSLGDKLCVPAPPAWMSISIWRYAWLIPLTGLVQYFMTGFGADTSSGLLPIPAVLAYYALFFAVGAMLYVAHDEVGVVGRRWWIALPVSLLFVFPIAMRIQTIDSPVGHAALALCSATYAWLVCFGLLGLFRRHVSSENRTLRYVSDASYWMYLVHIPLIIYLQYLMRDWAISAWGKVPLLCLVTGCLLLLSYHWLVRYTPIGTLLNGPRRRPNTRLEL